MDAVEGNLRTAIALREVYVLPSYEGTVVSKFDNTYAAHAMGLIRDQLTLSVVAAVSRIWDGTPGAKSVPALINILRRPVVRDAVVRERRATALSLTTAEPLATEMKDDQALAAAIGRMAERDADQAQTEFERALSGVDRRIRAFMGSDATQSLKAMRDRVVAHTLEETRAEKAARESGETIAPLKRSDLDQILDETIAIVTELDQVVRAHHPSFEKLASVWKAYSNDFWQRISAEPKGRPTKTQQA